MTRPEIRDRLFGLLLLLIACTTMVLIGQRMPMLLMLLGLLVAALWVRQLRLPTATIAAVLVLLVLMLPLVSPPTFHRLVVQFLGQMKHFWTSDYGQLYVRALSMMTARPWFGFGFDAFRTHCHDPDMIRGNALVGVTDSQVIAEVGCNIHPHNYWLELGTSAGLPAMLLFTVLAAQWLYGIVRGVRPLQAPLRASVAVAAIVLLWPFASRSSLFVVDAGGWAFFIAGWGLAAARDGTRETVSG